MLGETNVNYWRSWENEIRAPGNSIVTLNSIRLIDRGFNNKGMFKINEDVGIEMDYTVLTGNQTLWMGYNLHDTGGTNIFDTHSVNSDFYDKPHPIGNFVSIAWIPANLLAEGTFIVSCAIFNHLQHEIHFHEKDAVMFSVIETFDGDTSRGNTTEHFPGIVRPLLKWEINKKN